MKTFLRPTLLAAFGLAGVSLIAGVGHAADKKPAEKAAGAPKYTIEEAMEKVHKGKDKSVFARVVAGKGSKEDKAAVVDAYESMVASKPPKGDAAAFQKKSQAVLDAAKAVAAGDDKQLGALKAAANCKACHDAHKE